VEARWACVTPTMAPAEEKKRSGKDGKDKEKKRRSRRSAEEPAAPSAMDEELEWLAQWIPLIFCMTFLFVCVGALYMSANGMWVTKQGRVSANERMSEEDKHYSEL